MTNTETELAKLLAADIVATASQYPDIREAEDFSALHDIYDANESVLAAFEALYGDLQEVFDRDEDGGGLSEQFTNDANAATDEVDRVLRVGGFEALVAMAAPQANERARAMQGADRMGRPFWFPADYDDEVRVCPAKCGIEIRAYDANDPRILAHWEAHLA